MMPPVKIVISGPVGAGKTTLIGTLSETPIVNTDEPASENIGKQYTTVAFDFGTMTIDDYHIYLFGTPGQERFDFMWEILCESAAGLLVLLDGSKPADFIKARNILDFITSQIAIPYVIGVTHLDAPRCWQPEDVADFFQVPSSLVIGTDPRSLEEAASALFYLFSVINQSAGFLEAGV